MKRLWNSKEEDICVIVLETFWFENANEIFGFIWRDRDKRGGFEWKNEKYFQIFRIKFRSFLTKKAIKCEEPKKSGKIIGQKRAVTAKLIWKWIMREV